MTASGPPIFFLALDGLGLGFGRRRIKSFLADFRGFGAILGRRRIGLGICTPAGASFGPRLGFVLADGGVGANKPRFAAYLLAPRRFAAVFGFMFVGGASSSL